MDFYNVVTVEVVGEPSVVSQASLIELCVDDVCGVSAGASAGETPGSSRPAVIDSDEGETVWLVDTPLDSAGTATATAYAADGSVLGTTSAELTWSTSDVGHHCGGGPVEGGPMQIALDR